VIGNPQTGLTMTKRTQRRLYKATAILNFTKAAITTSLIPKKIFINKGFEAPPPR